MNDTLLEQFKTLLKVFEAHRKSLEPTGASIALLDLYASLLKSLHKLSDTQIETLLSAPSDFTSIKSRKTIVVPDVTAMTLDEIEAMVSKEQTPRKILEAIAIKRFHVPKGSMRSFQNIELLREKLTTRIQNERAHHTIRDVARQSRT
jgi:hypothetical protein